MPTARGAMLNHVARMFDMGDAESKAGSASR